MVSMVLLLAGGKATGLHATALRRNGKGRRRPVLMHRAQGLPPALEALPRGFEVGGHTHRPQREARGRTKEVLEEKAGAEGLGRPAVRRSLGRAPENKVPPRARRHVGRSAGATPADP